MIRTRPSGPFGGDTSEERDPNLRFGTSTRTDSTSSAISEAGYQRGWCETEDESSTTNRPLGSNAIANLYWQNWRGTAQMPLTLDVVLPHQCGTLSSPFGGSTSVTASCSNSSHASSLLAAGGLGPGSLYSELGNERLSDSALLSGVIGDQSKLPPDELKPIY